MLIVFFFQSQLAFAGINKDLRTAAKTNDVEAVKTLLQEGADIESTNKKGKTPLILAAENNAYKAAIVLVRAGADVNAQHNNGGTPLYFAAKSDSVKIAQILLANGANPSIKNNDGYTPYEKAQDEESYLVQKLLRSGRSSVAIIFNYKGHNISDTQFKDAANAALRKRGWLVENETNNQVDGVLEKSDFTYKCRIIHGNNEIMVRYLTGYGVAKLNYLLNLEGDIRRSLGL